MSKKIAITLGDPGGIGPDICVLMVKKYIKKYHIVITDPDLLIHSAKKLNKKLYTCEYCCFIDTKCFNYYLMILDFFVLLQSYGYSEKGNIPE